MVVEYSKMVGILDKSLYSGSCDKAAIWGLYSPWQIANKLVGLDVKYMQLAIKRIEGRI